MKKCISLSAFLVLTLIVALFITACGKSNGSQSQQASKTQLVEVKTGTISNTISTSGTLEYGTTSNLSFGSSGKITQLSLNVGDKVTKGQVLAKLDGQNAQLALREAQANVDDAQKALDDAMNPYSAVDIAKAKTAVAQAAASLKNAQEALEKAEHPYSDTDIAKVRTAVDSAQLSLNSAQQTLQDIVQATSPDALKALDNARTAVKNAQLAFDNAKIDLDQTKTDWEAKVKTASDQRDTALAAYTGTLQKYLGLNLDSSQLNTDPSILFPQLGIDLKTLFDPNAPQSTEDDPFTPWNETVLYAWNVLVPKYSVTTDFIMTDIENSWNAFQTAEQNLNSVQAQSSKATSNSQSALDKASDTLSQSQDALNSILNPSPDAVKAKQIQLDTAKATLAKAQEDLDNMLSGPDTVDIALKESQVDSAQVALEQAQQDLQAILAGPDPAKVVRQQISLDKAKLALTQAQDNLNMTTITAPFDGVVSAVNLSVGQTAGANTTVLTLLEPTNLQMRAQVDEVDILQVQVGQQANITLSTSSTSATVQGKVVSISPTAKIQQGIASYDAIISLNPQIASRLKAGMSTTASLVISQKSDVLVVPTRAVKRTGTQLYVEVMVNGKTEQRNVTVGLSDSRNVEITSGLQEMEQVVVDTSTSSTSSTNFRFTGQDGLGGLQGVLGGGTTGQGGNFQRFERSGGQ